MEGFYKYCIFLDIDGVLNNEIFYKKNVEKPIEKGKRRDQIDVRCVDLFNDLFERLGGEKDVLVVMSSTWRGNYQNILDANPLFKSYGAKWDFLDKTPQSKDRIRGVEIYKWLQDNSMKYFNKPYYDFKDYIILDDDSDMMLWQKENFFQTDAYCGLTPNLIYKIVKKFKGTFYHINDN